MMFFFGGILLLTIFSSSLVGIVMRSPILSQFLCLLYGFPQFVQNCCDTGPYLFARIRSEELSQVTLPLQWPPKPPIWVATAPLGCLASGALAQLSSLCYLVNHSP